MGVTRSPCPCLSKDQLFFITNVLKFFTIYKNASQKKKSDRERVSASGGGCVLLLIFELVKTANYNEYEISS